MAITDLYLPQSPETHALYVPAGMGDIRFPYTDDQQLSISIGTMASSQFADARMLEHKTFVELGDRPAAFPSPADDEFLPYDKDSAFVLARVVPTGAAEVPEDAPLVGMNRFTPWTPELGNKTVTDLAAIPYSTHNLETRAQVLEALGVIDIEGADITVEALARIIMGRLCLDNGSCDPEKTVDVATLAPETTLEFGAKLQVVDALLGATTIYLLRAQEDKRFSHFTQFTERTFSSYMRKNGYPSEPIAGLKKIFYDTMGDGQAMTANPQVTDIADLRQVVEQAAPESHQGRVGAIYKAHFL